jgi:hypothetical protein
VITFYKVRLTILLTSRLSSLITTNLPFVSSILYIPGYGLGLWAWRDRKPPRFFLVGWEDKHPISEVLGRMSNRF